MLICLCVYFNVDPVSSSKGYVRSQMNVGLSYAYMSPSVPIMEGIYSIGGILFGRCIFVGAVYLAFTLIQAVDSYCMRFGSL